MPVIVRPDEMPPPDEGDGWKVTTPADRQTTGAPGMVARRWTLAPSARGPEVARGPGEHLLYVIRGSGIAIVGTDRHPLAHETVVWLEPGDGYRLEAGDDGLEVLEASAPAG